MLTAAAVVGALACLLIPRMQSARSAEQVEQAELAHGEAALVAAGTVVGDRPE
jgi:hypothetical protein